MHIPEGVNLPVICVSVSMDRRDIQVNGGSEPLLGEIFSVVLQKSFLTNDVPDVERLLIRQSGLQHIVKMFITMMMHCSKFSLV